MSDRRFDGLDDAALDGEIEQALAVEPSPEFVARVRTRIAADATPRMEVGLVRWVLVGGASTVAVGALVVLYFGLNPVRNTPTAGAATGIARVEPAERQETQDPVTMRTEAAEVVGPGAMSPTVTGRSERDAFAEVMVSASEVAGLRQALAMVQAGIEIVPAPEDQVSAGAEQMPDIVIDPITIEPIALARIEGVAE